MYVWWEYTHTRIYYIDKLPSQKRTHSVNEIEILNIINKLKNTNSSGIDKISTKSIKVVKHLIAKPDALIIIDL